MFTIRNYTSKERYSLEKFLDFQTDCYDVINSPFLAKIKQLPTTQYYDVNSGYKDIDMISQQVYNSPFYSFYILFYNDLTTEVVPENTTLNLFSLKDLDNLYYSLSNGIYN